MSSTPLSWAVPASDIFGKVCLCPGENPRLRKNMMENIGKSSRKNFIFKAFNASVYC